MSDKKSKTKLSLLISTAIIGGCLSTSYLFAAAEPTPFGRGTYLDPTTPSLSTLSTGRLSRSTSVWSFLDNPMFLGGTLALAVGSGILTYKIYKRNQRLQKQMNTFVLKGNRIATLNGTGYVYLTRTPIGSAFVERYANPGMNLLEMGIGFNDDLVMQALRQGAHYTANDICDRHLSILKDKVKTSLGTSENLTLICGKVPDCLKRVTNTYDAILMEKVIHFMNPEEILKCIEWIKKSLKPGGRVYITATSPFSYAFKKSEAYSEKKKYKNIEFPGHFTDMDSSLDCAVRKRHPEFKFPNEMVLFATEDLVELFSKNGFVVETSCSLNPPKEDGPWLEVDDREASVVGLVAYLP